MKEKKGERRRAEPPLRRGLCRTGQWILAFLVTGWGPVASVMADALPVTLQSSVTEGSCDITVSPSALRFGGYRPVDFTANNGTVQLLPLTVTVTGCTGTMGPGQIAALRLTGNDVLSGTQDTVFSAGVNQATDAGFMVRSGDPSGFTLASFYDETRAIANGAYSDLAGPGVAVPAGTPFVFSVGFVSTGGAATPPGLSTGAVNAQLTFEFKYH